MPPGLPYAHVSWFVGTPVAWKGSYVPWGEQGLWEAARGSLSLLPRWGPHRSACDECPVRLRWLISQGTLAGPRTPSGCRKDQM